MLHEQPYKRQRLSLPLKGLITHQHGESSNKMVNMVTGIDKCKSVWGGGWCLSIETFNYANIQHRAAVSDTHSNHLPQQLLHWPAVSSWPSGLSPRWSLQHIRNKQSRRVSQSNSQLAGISLSFDFLAVFCQLTANCEADYCICDCLRCHWCSFTSLQG